MSATWYGGWLLPSAPTDGNPARDPATDVRSALCTLGFTAGEATAAARHAIAHVGAGSSLATLIAAALRACPRPRSL